MMLLKYCTKYVSKFGKLSSGHRTGKCQFSSQFPRKAILKNNQSAKQFCSLLLLVRLCSKSFKLAFSSSTWIEIFLFFFNLFKLEANYFIILHWFCHTSGFRKARGIRDHIVNIWWIIEDAREFHKSMYFCFPY